MTLASIVTTYSLCDSVYVIQPVASGLQVSQVPVPHLENGSHAFFFFSLLSFRKKIHVAQASLNLAR